jgi:hypothetical protein
MALRDTVWSRINRPLFGARYRVASLFHHATFYNPQACSSSIARMHSRCLNALPMRPTSAEGGSVSPYHHTVTPYSQD